jgi:hypothetical protein
MFDFYVISYTKVLVFQQISCWEICSKVFLRMNWIFSLNELNQQKIISLWFYYLILRVFNGTALPDYCWTDYISIYDRMVSSWFEECFILSYYTNIARFSDIAYTLDQTKAFQIQIKYLCPFAHKSMTYIFYYMHSM